MHRDSLTNWVIELSWKLTKYLKKKWRLDFNYVNFNKQPVNSCLFFGLNLNVHILTFQWKSWKYHKRFKYTTFGLMDHKNNSTNIV